MSYPYVIRSFLFYRFLPITMLRSPYHRYLSEWLQVRTYGQWRPYKGLKCFPLSRENSCFENGNHIDYFPAAAAYTRPIKIT